MRAAFALIAAALVASCGAPEPSRVARDVGGPTATAITPGDPAAFFDCLRENSRAVVAAHRGGPAPGYAENAIATFEHTLSQAPALLEIDIAITRDAELVLMHDDTVDRTTTGSGGVIDYTLSQLRELQLKDENGQVLDARVPTLAEALAWADGKTVLELDIKRGVLFEDVVRVVREAGAANRVILITYSPEAALRLHDLAPEMMISVGIDDIADLDQLERAGVDLTRILAWTGTDEPNSALNIALAARGVEVLFGTLGGGGSWDRRFAREGDQYAAFAETGIHLIATDRPIEAARDLDAGDGADGYAALQCVQ